MCSAGSPGIQGDLPASASVTLVLKACAPTPGPSVLFVRSWEFVPRIFTLFTTSGEGGRARKAPLLEHGEVLSSVVC